MIYLYISPHYNQYGCEQSLISLMNYVKERKSTPLLIIPKNGLIVELAREHNIEYKIIPFRNWVNTSNKSRRVKCFLKLIINYIFAVILSMLLRKYKDTIGVVHSNSIVSPFGYQLARVLRCPHIQHIREFGKEDFDMSFDMGMKFSLGKIDKYSKSIICISKSVYNKYKYYIDDNKLNVIYNGVNPRGVTRTRERLGDEILIVLVGRLSEEKRQIDAIVAIESLRKNHNFDIRMDLYGDGVLENYLKDYVVAHGLENIVSFKGFVENIPLSEYDIGIITSPHEAFGRVTVEYMAAGLPVIGTRNDATGEIVVDGETGLLYPIGDIGCLAECIQKLSEDNALRSCLGRNGKKRFDLLFTEETYCDAVMKIYEKIVL